MSQSLGIFKYITGLNVIVVYYRIQMIFSGASRSSDSQYRSIQSG